MFRKIVSQLSFSPALVGQLGFYARRLRKEEATRRLGLIFTALALVVQSLVVFQAPEPANAASNNDFIPGGLGTGSNVSLKKFLNPYDKNERKLKDVMNHFGITRKEIANAKYQKFQVKTRKSYGFENRAGSTKINIKDNNGKHATTIYGRPMSVWGYKSSDWVYGYVGHSAKEGWFAILAVCGNLITEDLPDDPPEPKPAKIVASKSAVNVTQGGVDAKKVTAKEKDRIRYTVQVKNTGGTAKSVTMRDDLSEVLKYGKLVNNGGGTYKSGKKLLTWGKVEVKPGQTVTKKYVVQLNNSLISSTTKCKMKNDFLDKSITIDVGCKKPPANIVSSKSAINTSQGNVNATLVMAKENDKITYSATVKNTGGTAQTVTMEDDLSDVLEFASLVDRGGGTFNSTTKTLSWPKVSVKAKQTITKKYTVQINGDLTNDTTACRIVNQFMDQSVTIRVACKTPPADVVVGKSATNLTQGNVDATKTVANASDRISFTITAQNNGGTAQDFLFEDTLHDALEYATLINNGGGVFDEKAETLTWPMVTLKPGQKEVRTFTMQLLSAIPATPVGVSDTSSYNCTIENTFYEAYVLVPVNCPVPKEVIEQVVPELPQTGPRENMMFAGVLFSVVLYFYLRSRQLGTEVRLIRRNVNGGTI